MPLDGSQTVPMRSAPTNNKRELLAVQSPSNPRVPQTASTSDYAVDSLTARKVIRKVDTDMTRWRSPKHLASWLGLSTNDLITGSKVINSRTKASSNRAAALRLAANALHRSDSAP